MLKTPAPGHAGHAVPFSLAARVPGIARIVGRQGTQRVPPLTESGNGQEMSERSGVLTPVQTAANTISLWVVTKDTVKNVHMKRYKNWTEYKECSIMRKTKTG